ncbi:hypothetical protein ABB37_08302 [Leptomonas pyrrhocoris]|uniref:Uncharacterized protein n=1 Tax=Leptomonas pyrrhocoris TaxID=157538 RepID=A0A0M9FTP7_LEPPY|nr:hypothetical protein ABB37_08302 [Leptomonas pyrrhocoris]KPA75767.1 hypothetical protein ABB37_08302 [Leptomonas pyrrhocoris]|eukprot:XP_015654206.1 hypothetical protein ABB37_08302 [Leptomonas pyrrhocoris]
MGSSPLSAIEVTTSPITTTAAVGTTPGPSAVKSNNARATTRATAAQRRALTRLERGVCGLSKPEWHPMGLLSPTAPPRRPSSATAGRPSLRGEGADGAAEASELSFYERALLEAAKAMSSI